MSTTANTVADQHFGAISQLQVELRSKLADVDRNAATWHREEYCKLLPTYVGERAARLLFGESQSVQSASSDTASADQRQPEQPDRCLPPSPSVPTSTLSAPSSSDDALVSGTDRADRDNGTCDATPQVHPVEITGRTSGPSNIRSRLVSRATPSSSDRRHGSASARVLTRSRAQVSAVPRSPPIRTSVRPRVNPRNIPRANSGRLSDKEAVLAFLREEGLHSYSLTPQEAAQASHMPDITQSCFVQTFGHFPNRERTRSGAMIINSRLQLYGPSSLGQPGLLFLKSNPIPPEAVVQEPFLAFVQVLRPISLIKIYRYLGTYIRVPILRTTLGVDEWHALPPFCRHMLCRRMFTLTSPDGRALHARLALRRQHGREPSPDEVQIWLTENHRPPSQVIKQSTINGAYRTGEEQMAFEVVKCIGYDIEVAKKMEVLM